MIQKLPLGWQIPTLTAALFLSISPAAISLVRQSQADLMQKSKESNDRYQAVKDEQTALSRARTCIPIDESYPIEEGASAYYDRRGRKSNRLLPTGTNLCSLSGHTARVDKNGTMRDIKQLPIERMKAILKQRGVI